MDKHPIEAELQQFKINMAVMRPFFGDILLKIPLIRNDSVGTACTDGRTIEWSLHYFETLRESERHFVIMHEVLHILLMHPSRLNGRDPIIWNVAADLIVNHICNQLLLDLERTPATRNWLKKPAGLLYNTSISPDDTVESLYQKILDDNTNRPNRNTLNLREIYSYKLGKFIPYSPESDLIYRPLTEQDAKTIEIEVREMISKAKAYSEEGNFFVPREVLSIVQAKPLNWRRLLKEFLSETQSEETSYATPERKYFHMDLILPGHGLSPDEELECVWAFIDCSGSISQAEASQFIAQLVHIVKNFHCELNIAYWDTKVSEVYRNIRNESGVRKAIARHSGGTDLNCVYQWVAANHVRPLVSLILTDGYFGHVEPSLQTALPKNKTILVLSSQSENPQYKTIGKIARL